ncbi:hypothetical protein Rpal_0683 [Rhodopseudomonas palustris TIE-1]|uniref:hypothetical protein n=1 Tax=Rhodopseudomonas palustris TaxID=1076 RepID=UPI000164AB9C|nr:hypothetical protein [Rhodopseudomonas palustris]ACE99242.1 hypothetical protein Rpal_0683 [Rhodopseudomonas palustris TIE-1]
METETKSYRITKPRPIGGRMRKPGEIVGLTAREYAAEAGWGGLEEVKAEATAAEKVEQAVTVEPEVEQQITSTDNPDQPETAETAAPTKKRAK